MSVAHGFPRDAGGPYHATLDLCFAAGPLGHLLIGEVIGADDVLLLTGPYAEAVPSARLRLVGISLDAIAQVTGDPALAVPGRLRLSGQRPVSEPAARQWRLTVRYLGGLLAGDGPAPGPLLAGGAARLAAAAALTAVPRAAAGPVAHETRDAHPAALRRAVAFIDANAHRDIGPADIAAAAVVTVRSVQLAFRRHLGTTPTAYLRGVRLDHAHRDLQAADPARETVARIAARWGFANHSRFTATYHAAYRTRPSDTLRGR